MTQENYEPLASIRGPPSDRRLWERWVKQCKARKVRVWDKIRAWIKEDLKK